MKAMHFAVLIVATAVLTFAPLPAVAADVISVGSVDATSANLWPLHIADKNGYFDAANLKIDLVFSQSNASVIQQLAAGSYSVAPSAGMVDPIRAIDKGAPVALVRIVIQAPPYALLAKHEIVMLQEAGNPESWEALIGKKVESGTPTQVGKFQMMIVEDPAALNLRCSVALFVRGSLEPQRFGVATSTATYRALVYAVVRGGVVGSFHALASNGAFADWKATLAVLLKQEKPGWWLVGGDFNDDLIDRADVDDSGGIVAHGGITQKKGLSIDGFKLSPARVQQLSSMYVVKPEDAEGSRIAFVSDHQAMACAFKITL